MAHRELSCGVRVAIAAAVLAVFLVAGSAGALMALDGAGQALKQSGIRAGAGGLEWAVRCIWGLLIAGLAGVGAVLFLLHSGMVDLRRVAAQMLEGSRQVAAASGQVAAASQSLAQGTSQQVSSLEQTSASAGEITAVTRKNGENTRAVAGLMNATATVVAGANQNLEQMVNSMQEIDGSSQKISRIIKVIDEIAFQTNILALNAAVEAARAGEAGMGFAVVAGEVRNLAQRSAQAAKDTAALIEESIARSQEGSRQLEQVVGSIRQITGSSGQVKTLVDEVEAGSREQARGIEQIAGAVGEMERLTQQSAAHAEEGAAASEELATQAQSLYRIVDRLQVLVGTGASAAGPEVGTGSQAPAAKRCAAPAHDPAAHVPSPEFPLDDDRF